MPRSGSPGSGRSSAEAKPRRRPGQSLASPLRTIAIAFSSLSFAIVRYLARLARSTSGIDRTTSGARRTATSSSTASASWCLAWTSESSVRLAVACSRRWPVQALSAVRRFVARRGPGSDRDRLLAVVRRVVVDDGARTRGATVDLLAQLDERELAAGHPGREAAALLLVGDLHQLVGMGEGVFAHRHELPDLLRRVGEAEPVLEIPLVLAELLGELADAVAMVADHPVVHRRFLERREVLALEVLDDRDLERGVVVELFDESRDRDESGLLRGPPAALAGDELVAAAAERPDQDRLEDAVLTHRGGTARGAPRRRRSSAADLGSTRCCRLG